MRRTEGRKEQRRKFLDITTVASRLLEKEEKKLFYSVSAASIRPPIFGRLLTLGYTLQFAQNEIKGKTG